MGVWFHGTQVKQVAQESTQRNPMASRVDTVPAEEWRDCTNSQLHPSGIARHPSKTVRAVGPFFGRYHHVQVRQHPCQPSESRSLLISSKLGTVESGITLADLNKTVETMDLTFTNVCAFDAARSQPAHSELGPPRAHCKQSASCRPRLQERSNIPELA